MLLIHPTFGYAALILEHNDRFITFMWALLKGFTFLGALSIGIVSSITRNCMAPRGIIFGTWIYFWAVIGGIEQGKIEYCNSSYLDVLLRFVTLVLFMALLDDIVTWGSRGLAWVEGKVRRLRGKGK